MNYSNNDPSNNNHNMMTTMMMMGDNHNVAAIPPPDGMMMMMGGGHHNHNHNHNNDAAMMMVSQTQDDDHNVLLESGQEDDEDDDDDDDEGLLLEEDQHDPQQQQQQQSRLKKKKVAVDRVNGIGMWKAWTRSFDTPMLALLDLFDNAIDASLTLLSHAHASQPQQPPKRRPKIAIDLDDIGQQGVVLRNSCLFTIPPMKQVLEVYKSSKANDQTAIGENGIGVKHACASLSSLSIILTKTSDYYSMGILMEELQRPEGVVLPSCQWDITSDMESQLHHKAQQEPDTWGRAILQYGGGGNNATNAATTTTSTSYDEGIDRLLRHFEQMTKGQDWKDYPNVFTVILTELRHVATSDEDDDENAAAAGRVADDLQDDDGGAGGGIADDPAQRSYYLLKELKNTLPIKYIHIHPLDVQVQYETIQPLYWEKRLVELTQFAIPINPSKSWKKDPTAMAVATAAVGSSGTGLLDEHGEPTLAPPYPVVRFFLGFDAYRSGQRKHSTVKLYLYSRESGRLIKVNEDPRSVLGLNSGSTDYKQGLTILVDDVQGTIPLNPTKQDTAFGHSHGGKIHFQNLMDWIGCLTHFYWSRHKERLGDSKQQLTQAVVGAIPYLMKHFPANRTEPITPLGQGNYIRFPQLQFKAFQGEKLRVSKNERTNAIPLVGPDAVVQLVPPPPRRPPTAGTAKSTRGRRKRNSSGTSFSLTPADDDDFDDLMIPTTPNTSTTAVDILDNDDNDKDEQQQPQVTSSSSNAQGRKKYAKRSASSMTSSMMQHDNDNDDMPRLKLEELLEKREMTIAKLYQENVQKDRQLQTLQEEHAQKVQQLEAQVEKYETKYEETREALYRLEQEQQGAITPMTPPSSQQPSTPSSSGTPNSKMARELALMKNQVKLLHTQLEQKNKKMRIMEEEYTTLQEQVEQLQQFQQQTLDI